MSFFSLKQSLLTLFLGFSFCLSSGAFAVDSLKETTYTNNVQIADLNSIESGVAGILAARGPGQTYLQNQLSFTFDASQQYYATGYFKGIVTFPDQSQYTLIGQFDGSPVTLEVGSPSLAGTYTLTFVVTNLTGTIDPTKGPFYVAKNITKNQQVSGSFNVLHQGDQSSATFINSN